MSFQLKQIEPAWNRLNAVRRERDAISEDLDQYIEDKNALLLNSTNDITLLNQGKKQWQQYRANESVLYALFSWLPVVRTKRHYQMNFFLEETFGAKMVEFKGSLPEDIDAFIEGLISQASKEQVGYQKEIELAQDISRRESEASQRWRELTYSLGHSDADEVTLSKADELADTGIRFLRSYWQPITGKAAG